MKNKMLLIGVLLLTSQAGLAQQRLSKRDFAYGYELAIPERKSLVEVVVPEDVYQSVKSPVLFDVAIFNEKDEQVPHQLLVAVGQTLETQSAPVGFTLFPLARESSAEKTFRDIKVETSADGAIVEIHQSQGEGQEAQGQKAVAGYLLDASKLKEDIDQLEVRLEQPVTNYLVKVDVEGSQDLVAWTSVASSAVLAKFEVGGETLEKNRVPLHGMRAKYYRLSWPGEQRELKVQTVSALFAKGHAVVEAPLTWKGVAGTQEPGTAEVINHYDLSGAYPVSGLKVRFFDQNSVARVTIEGASDPAGPWQFVQSSMFYSVFKEGSELANLETTFPERQFRYWRVRLKSNPAGIGARFPEVSLGWRPGSIRFLARGEGPFVLAFGNAKAVNSSPASDLVSVGPSEEVVHATLGNRMTLGGPEKLVSSIAQEGPWKKIALWTVLVLGVLLLGAMASQVRKTPPTSES